MVVFECYIYATFMHVVCTFMPLAYHALSPYALKIVCEFFKWCWKVLSCTLATFSYASDNTACARRLAHIIIVLNNRCYFYVVRALLSFSGWVRALLSFSGWVAKSSFYYCEHYSQTAPLGYHGNPM